jgi:putative ABC transport system permease protein
MRIEEINYSIRNLLHRKQRSLLTVLSILIGVMAIYAIISFGIGIQNYVDSLASESGVDKIFVQAKGIGAPGSDDTFFLSAEDIDFMRKINGVQIAEGMYMKAGEITYGKESKFNFVSGFNPKEVKFIWQSFGVSTMKGREIRNGDTFKAMLGYRYTLPNTIFTRPVEVGDRIEINGVQFEAIGFLEEIGNPSDDSQVYLTQEGMEILYPEIKDKFAFVMIQSDKISDPEVVAERIAEKLRKRKGQKEGEEDFFVQTFADAIATFGTVINVINGVLVLIALVSLIVASVNIMNTMYTAVLERTKEIGIMKAIGAKNEDILLIFVFESGFLGMMGGIVGVIIGYLVSSAGGAFAKSAGYALLQPAFPWYLTFGCIMFAFFVGALAGILPALSASRQKPVDALRYE